MLLLLLLKLFTSSQRPRRVGSFSMHDTEPRGDQVKSLCCCFGQLKLLKKTRSHTGLGATKPHEVVVLVCATLFLF